MTECLDLPLTELAFWVALLVVFAIAETLFTLTIGYVMGRNSAGQPVKAQVEPLPDVIKKQDTTEPEGDYFSDEIPVYQDRPRDEERIKTV